MGKRVLVVDDSTFLSDLYAAELQTMGFTCDAVSTPAEALLLAREQSYHLALIDYWLEPDFHGLMLGSMLKAEYELPFIIITGRASSEQCRECLCGGADYYLMKSENIEAIIESVARVAAGRPCTGKGPGQQQVRDFIGAVMAQFTRGRKECAKGLEAIYDCHMADLSGGDADVVIKLAAINRSTAYRILQHARTIRGATVSETGVCVADEMSVGNELGEA